MLGDMVKTGGAVVVNGSMSVVTQQPWLINDTVLNNIVFGHPLDIQKYNDILNVCCLYDDIQSLPGKHHCEIAEGGVNLSGGQKARIAFARACYSDSDIVIMDDPLAAVDAKVGKTIFDQCICNYMNKRTRILVTNAVQYLSRCDYVVILGEGGIEHQGTFADLKKKDIPFLKETIANNRSDDDDDDDDDDDEHSPYRLDVFLANQQLYRKAVVLEDLRPIKEMKEGKLVTAESKAQGTISWEIYQYYLKANGAKVMTVCFLFILLYLLTYIPASFRLSAWVDAPPCEGTEEVCQAVNTTYLSMLNSLYFLPLSKFNSLRFIINFTQFGF